MDIYKEFVKLENNEFLLRELREEDCDDLLKVYSDILAVPCFNGDSCHGDNFYYQTKERMKQALDFWLEAYRNYWFVRWAIVDKATNEVIGTIEGFHRESEDYFNDCGLMRIDVRSDYEVCDKLISIITLITKPSFEFFYTNRLVTKGFASSKERLEALTKLGYVKSNEPLIGSVDHLAYYDYWYIYK